MDKTNKNSSESLLQIILPNILQRFASSEDFSTLCQHDIFTKDKLSPLYNFKEKTLLITLFQ